MDVWQHTSLGNGHTSKQLALLLIVAHSQLNVPWHDTGLLVVTGSVASQIQNFGSQVLEHGSEVDWGTGSNSGGSSRVSEVSGNSSNWELKSSLGGSGHGS